MENEGPLLETLLHRLGDCPAEFLAEPRNRDRGSVDVSALVCDLFRAMRCSPAALVDLAILRHAGDEASTNRLRLVAVGVWLLADEVFCRQPELAPAMWSFLSAGLDRLSAVVRADVVVKDPDRREEFVRLCLKQLGLRPQDETVTEAADRLTALDSVERDRVIRQTRAAESRAREIREMMARRAAEEAAAKVSRE